MGSLGLKNARSVIRRQTVLLFNNTMSSSLSNMKEFLQYLSLRNVTRGSRMDGSHNKQITQIVLFNVYYAFINFSFKFIYSAFHPLVPKIQPDRILHLVHSVYTIRTTYTVKLPIEA